METIKKVKKKKQKTKREKEKKRQKEKEREKNDRGRKGEGRIEKKSEKKKKGRRKSVFHAVESDRQRAFMTDCLELILDPIQFRRCSKCYVGYCPQKEVCVYAYLQGRIHGQ